MYCGAANNVLFITKLEVNEIILDIGAQSLFQHNKQENIKQSLLKKQTLLIIM